MNSCVQIGDLQSRCGWRSNCSKEEEIGEGVELTPGTFFQKANSLLQDVQVIYFIILFPWQMDYSEMKLAVCLNEKETAEQLHQVVFPAVTTV